MTRSFAAALTAALPLAWILACASQRDPVTLFEASQWSPKYGAPSSQELESARSMCLRTSEIDDAARVIPDGRPESRFARCMSQQGWCTDIYPCH